MKNGNRNLTNNDAKLVFGLSPEATDSRERGQTFRLKMRMREVELLHFLVTSRFMQISGDDRDPKRNRF
jgi:hypothetical protein